MTFPSLKRAAPLGRDGQPHDKICRIVREQVDEVLIAAIAQAQQELGNMEVAEDNNNDPDSEPEPDPVISGPKFLRMVNELDHAPIPSTSMGPYMITRPGNLADLVYFADDRRQTVINRVPAIPDLR